MNSRAESGHANTKGFFAAHRDAMSEAAFHRMISIETRRTRRSRKSFLLMLLDMGEHSTSRHHRLSLKKVQSALSLMLRETDVTGWYEEDSVVGVMFTEITFHDQSSIPATLMTRVSQTLRNCLTAHQFQQIGISFHLLPEARDLAASAQSEHLAVLRTPPGAQGAIEPSL